MTGEPSPVVLPAETYDGILRWVIAAQRALSDEGIGAGHSTGETVELPPGVLEAAADLVGLSLCDRWDLRLVTDDEHTAGCDCYTARRDRGEPDTAPVDRPTDRLLLLAAAAAADTEARYARERAEGRRVPWEHATPDTIPPGAAWSFEYRQVTDGSETDWDVVTNEPDGQTRRLRPHGEAVLINAPGFPRRKDT